MDGKDLIGRTLGPYEIVEFIGSGGQAEIYKGFHPELERYVAIKIVGRFLDDDPIFNTRFRREAKAIAQLRHPNIVQVYDFGAAEGGHYMVMEYVEGVSLAVVIEETRLGINRLSPDDISFIIRQIASALDHAHARGVIHRDVKPDNIMITRAGQAILADFGLALLRSRHAEDQSAGTAFGTPEYMAPEQITDSRAASASSDLYSLGVILYEILTGQLPFQADNPLDLAMRHLSDMPTDPRLLDEGIPPAVAAVILKSLSKRPKDRFRTGMHLATSLERAFLYPDDTSFIYDSPSSDEHREQVPLHVVARPTPEPVVVNRGLSHEEERLERKRLRAEHERIKREEKGALARKKRALRQKKRREFFNTWGRTLAVMGIAALLIVAGAFILQTTGIIDINVRPPDVAPVAAIGIPAPSQTETPAARALTPTSPPTATSVPTATPLVGIEATAIPPQSLVPLQPGSQGFRVHDGSTMAYVPAGSFLMGTNDRFRNQAEQPQHTVALSAYWIDRTEVSNAQYRVCVEEGPCQPPQDTTSFDDPARVDFPVTFVTYDAAVSYCLWLANKSQMVTGLPTEAQWEKAASWDPVTQTARLYPWGDDFPRPDLLRYNESNTTVPAAPVGSYPLGASAYNVLDMAGNVWEWVADWFDPDYYKRTGILTDPTGPANGTFRITRGGSWTRSGQLAISSVRNPIQSTSFSNEIGFRCAMSGERPPLSSGIAITPLDTITLLSEQVESARGAGTDVATLSGWAAALSSIQTEIQTGNSVGALGQIEEQLIQLDPQVESGLLPAALGGRLEGGLLWIQSQLVPSGS